MRDLDRALTDISVIRDQLAQSTEFQGYAPPTLAGTGVFALLVAATQGLWLPEAATNMRLFISLWVGTAVLCVIVIAIETIRRSRRAHGGFATAMLQSAIEQFLPAIVAGGLLTAALLEVAPQNLWMIPGLWHIVFSLGVFASRRFLPRPIFWVGVWYLACGLVCLALAAPAHVTSPWEMGIPYGIGQLLVAGILQYRGTLELSR
ncbi:MAG TPA: hypothetical protein VGC34_01645 [Steroidobacteraceae bacterium]